jgi:hypothetical protein
MLSAVSNTSLITCLSISVAKCEQFRHLKWDQPRAVKYVQNWETTESNWFKTKMRARGLVSLLIYTINFVYYPSFEMVMWSPIGGCGSRQCVTTPSISDQWLRLYYFSPPVSKLRRLGSSPEFTALWTYVIRLFSFSVAAFKLHPKQSATHLCNVRIHVYFITLSTVPTVQWPMGSGYLFFSVLNSNIGVASNKANTAFS